VPARKPAPGCVLEELIPEAAHQAHDDHGLAILSRAGELE
jgi:hypothetical protein